VGARLDGTRHRLAAKTAGHAHHGGVGHPRVIAQHLLELGAVDRVPTPVDDVLDPIDDGHVPVGVDAGNIAGGQPPLRRQRRGGRRRVVEIAGGDQRAAQHQLAGPGAGVATVGVDAGRLHARQRTPCRVGAREQIGVKGHGGRRVGLGQPVDVVPGRAGHRPAQLVQHRHRHGRATERGQAHRGGGLGVEAAAAQQQLPERRGGVGPRDRLAAQCREVGRRVGGRQQHAGGPGQGHGQQVGTQPRDVGQREHHRGAVVRAQAQQGLIAVGAVHRGAVDHLHGLGRPGGARGEHGLETGGLVGAVLGGKGPWGGRGAKDRLGVAHAGRRETGLGQRLLQLGAARGGGRHHAGAHRGELASPLPHPHARVEPGQDQPRAGTGEHGHGQRQAVGRGHRHPGAGLGAGVDQPRGGALGQVGQLGVGHPPRAAGGGGVAVGGAIPVGGGTPSRAAARIAPGEVDDGLAVAPASHGAIERVEDGGHTVGIAQRRRAQPRLAGHPHRPTSARPCSAAPTPAASPITARWALTRPSPAPARPWRHTSPRR